MCSRRSQKQPIILSNTQCWITESNSHSKDRKRLNYLPAYTRFIRMRFTWACTTLVRSASARHPLVVAVVAVAAVVAAAVVAAAAAAPMETVPLPFLTSMSLGALEDKVVVVASKAEVLILARAIVQVELAVVAAA